MTIAVDLGCKATKQTNKQGTKSDLDTLMVFLKENFIKVNFEEKNHRMLRAA